MKTRVAIIILFFFVLVSCVYANPFLVSEPYQLGVTEFQVEIIPAASLTIQPDPNGIYILPSDPNNLCRIEVDLIGIADGLYKARGRACNLFGCSSFVELDFEVKSVGQFNKMLIKRNK